MESTYKKNAIISPTCRMSHRTAQTYRSPRSAAVRCRALRGWRRRVDVRTLTRDELRDNGGIHSAAFNNTPNVVGGAHGIHAFPRPALVIDVLHVDYQKQVTFHFCLLPFELQSRSTIVSFGSPHSRAIALSMGTIYLTSETA